MTRADFDDLAARLELPAAAAREQRLHLARGRPRHAAPRTPATALSHPARLAATILRHRHNLPYHAIAYLLGVSSDTATTAITQTTSLLAQHGVTITARHPADRPRRPPRLRSRRRHHHPRPAPQEPPRRLARNRPATRRELTLFWNVYLTWAIFRDHGLGHDHGSQPPCSRRPGRRSLLSSSDF